MQAMKKNGNPAWLVVVILLLSSVIAYGVYYLSITPLSLPTDEEVIAHFKAHRTELDELVRRFQEFTPPVEKIKMPDDEEGKQKVHDMYNWEKQHSDTQELLDKAGVWRLERGIIIFSPDSYALEWDDKVSEAFTFSENSVIPKTDWNKYNEIQRHKIISFRMKLCGKFMIKPCGKYSEPSLLHKGVSKQLLYSPFAPEIKQGLLWGKRDRNGNYMNKYRVFSSLDRYPSNWKKGECVFRQIEANWFIALCKTY